MRLADFKIGTRLGLAFGSVVLVSIVSAGLALHKMSVIEDNLVDIVTDNNVKMEINHDMADAAHDVAELARNVVLVDEKSDITAQRDQLVLAQGEYEKARAALEKFPASPKGRVNRNRIDEAAAAVKPVIAQVVTLGLENKDSEAIAVLMKKASPLTHEWQAAIDANIEFQKANTDAQYAASTNAYDVARYSMIAANLIGVVFAALLGWIITRSVTAPMNIAMGAAERVANGDLSVSVTVEGKDETAALLHSLVKMRDNLAGIVSGVRENAEGVATASSQISQGNHDLSARTEQQASALEETAASMEELSSTVRLNADNAKQANELARGASSVAVKGGAVVNEVVGTMRDINDSSKKISDIIGVIDGIAFQTNILALNAAVEAARAGEQGRGFAVVASEVRSLAQRSAQAAREIKALISTSVERVERGTSLVDQAGVTMTEVVDAIKRVTDIMSEISAASNEQSAGVSQIGEAVASMDQVTQQNAALVEESAAAAESLKNQAEQLVTAVSVFQLRTKDAAYAH
jgi:methyl-accepting chemotaxis protein